MSGIDENPAQQLAALVRGGNIAGAVRLLETQIELGDGQAAATLAGWRLSGDLIRRDLSHARDLFAKAVELGQHGVETVLIALLANGAGGYERRWNEAVDRLSARARNDPRAAQDMDLLADMEIDQHGDPTGLPNDNEIHANPRITSFPGFLTLAECRFLCEVAAAQLRPATVGDPRTGQVLLDPVRRAKTTGFPFIAESPVIHAINRRIAAATGTAYEQGEPLQIIAYESGDEFKLHSDAVTHDSNQRMLTFLVTLEDGFTGGATAFPKLDLELRSNLGGGLMFTNTDDAGRTDPLAWHAGLPVKSGRKVILSKWIRSRPLDLSGPQGRPL